VRLLQAQYPLASAGVAVKDRRIGPMVIPDTMVCGKDLAQGILNCAWAALHRGKSIRLKFESSGYADEQRAHAQ
jgi:hypothetical protein